jgi:hypothetical protein
MIGGIVVAAALVPSANAGSKVYQTGTLVKIESPETGMRFGPFRPTDPVLIVPTHLFYNFDIQVGDVHYVAACGAYRYRPEWKVGHDVHFRLKKDQVYLKRPNGKEFRLDFWAETLVRPDGTSLMVRRRAKPMHF